MLRALLIKAESEKMPPKRYKDLYLRKDTYIKLQQLKATLGKRSLNDVIDELLKVFTVSTVNSPVNTVKSTVSPNVLTVNSNVSTVKQGEDPGNNELSKRLEVLERGVAELRDSVTALAREFKDFARRQQDLINAYTSKTDQTLQRLSQLVEAIESLNEKLDKVIELISKQQEKPRGSEERSAKRRSVCEILEEQHVIFESDVVARIRDRESFFVSIESRCNGVVIECSMERVAVEKSFWQSFLSKVNKISVSDDEKIKRELDAVEYRLFKILKESALLIYDAVKRQWVFAEQKSTSTSTEADNRSKRYYKKKNYEDDESWVLQYVDSERI